MGELSLLEDRPQHLDNPNVVKTKKAAVLQNTVVWGRVGMMFRRASQMSGNKLAADEVARAMTARQKDMGFSRKGG